MAGPLTVQRVPRGVLDYLGLRGSGDLPHELSNQVQLSVEAGALYGMDLLRATSKLLLALGTGFTTDSTLTVPSGELWVVANISAEIATAAASTFSGNVGYKRLQDNPGSCRILNTPSLTLAASQTGNLGNSCAFGEVILAPGDTIGVRCTAVTGTANATVMIDVYRLLW